MSFLALANCYLMQFQFQFSFVAELALAEEEIGRILVAYFVKFWKKFNKKYCFTIYKTILLEMLLRLLLEFNKLISSNLPNCSPNNFTLPKFNPIFFAFTFIRLAAFSVNSPNISSLFLYSFFAHQIFASRTYAILSSRFSKTSLQN